MEVKDRAAYESLRVKYNYLSSALQPHDILPSLFANGLISLVQKQEIECAIHERGPSQGCVKLLDILMSNGSEGTFQTFLDILRNQAHLVYLVPELQSEYEQQQASLQDQTREQQVTIVPLKTQELENKFLDIARRTTDRIRMKNMDTEEFRLQFIVQMEISKQDQHRQFIENYLMEVKPTTTVGDLLCRLSMYWNFLNYNLLQHLVDMFGDEQLKHDMEDYVEALKAFRANTKLCDFIKNWPLRGRKPSEADLRELVIRKVMDKKWEECTLEDVEMVEETLTHKFLLPDFVLRFGEAEKGSLCLTWYIPAPIAKTLQEDLPNVKTEFFKTHGIEQVTIDGAECFFTPVKKFAANYLKRVYTSEKPLLTVESSLPADNPLPFYLAKIEREEVNPSKADKFTIASIRNDIDDVMWQKKPMNVDEVGVLPDGSQPKLVLIEGAPGVGKTTFSWDFCTKWGRGEALQEYSIVVLLPLRDNRLKEATSLSDLFYHPDPNIQKAVLQEVSSMRGKGVLIWLEAFDELDEDKRTRSSIFLDLIYGKVLPDSTIFLTSRPWATVTITEKCKDRISQHIEILASADLQIKHYMEKRKSDPSTSEKFRDYLSFNPAVKAMMYTPVTADMVTKMFLFSRDTESLPPTTMTELYTAFTQTLLLKYLNSHPVHGREQRKTLTFNDLPDNIHKYFTKLCELAYGGILNGHQLVFPADQVDFDSLCLMQETPQLYMRKGSPSSFHFLHLTLQEYLAAVHISQRHSREQTEVIEQHLRHGHFKIVFRFLAGLTKLKNLTQNIIQQLLCGHDDDKLTLFHWLFESHSDATTVNVPCSKKMCITFQHTWTPLDFYVTGYCVAHSQCNWSLRSHATCIDDEKVELFSKGCHTSSTTTDIPAYSGCISSIHFGGNCITSEGIRHSINIPQHIRQGIRELSLLDNKLDALACDLLAKVVPEMPMLEELNIVHNPAIGNGGAVALIRSLYTSRLKILKLHHTRIGKEDCVCLSQLSKSSHHLKYLYITDNNLSSESVELITRGVAHSSSLTKLDMSLTPLSMEAIVDLASLLSEQADCKLEKLVLGHCHISSEGAAKLAEALRKNTTLRKLYLSRNPIGERVVGVTAIATMLVENKSLTKLGLEGCHISGQGAGELAEALCKDTTLRKLYLSRNPIGEHVVRVAAIATMLVENKSLTHLGLRDCHISGQGAGKLAAALRKNSTLQFLDLDHNPIGVEGASSMSDMLQHNKSLRQLYMSDNSVGEEGVHQLMHNVKYNQTLKHLQLPMKYKSEPSDNRILWR